MKIGKKLGKLGKMAKKLMKPKGLDPKKLLGPAATKAAQGMLGGVL